MCSRLHRMRIDRKRERPGYANGWPRAQCRCQVGGCDDALNPSATLSTIASPASPAVSAPDNRQVSASPSNSPQPAPVNTIATAVTASTREAMTTAVTASTREAHNKIENAMIAAVDWSLLIQIRDALIRVRLVDDVRHDINEVNREEHGHGQ
jgi:hypothetical protein